MVTQKVMSCCWGIPAVVYRETVLHLKVVHDCYTYSTALILLIKYILEKQENTDCTFTDQLEKVSLNILSQSNGAQLWHAKLHKIPQYQYLDEWVLTIHDTLRNSVNIAMVAHNCHSLY